MAKDQQAGVADSHSAVESGSNARIADILAYSMERLASHHKINAKPCCDAAWPVFEFADSARLCHSSEILSALEAARTHLQDKLSYLSAEGPGSFSAGRQSRPAVEERLRSGAVRCRLIPGERGRMRCPCLQLPAENVRDGRFVGVIHLAHPWRHNASFSLYEKQSGWYSVKITIIPFAGNSHKFMHF